MDALVFHISCGSSGFIRNEGEIEICWHGFAGNILRLTRNRRMHPVFKALLEMCR